MNLPEPPAKPPWVLDAERARAWARTYCWQSKVALVAFSEGWGRQAFVWAQSYAREHFRRGEVPSLEARPSKEDISYWKAHCLCPADWLGSERERFLGEAPEEVSAW